MFRAGQLEHCGIMREDIALRFVKFAKSLLFVSSVNKAVTLRCTCVQNDSSDSECFSYDHPYQPTELPVEYLSGIEKLFNNDSPFYSALFSVQGEVAEVNEEISYVEDEKNASNNVGIPMDLEPTVDIPYVADEENTIDLEPTV